MPRKRKYSGSLAAKVMITRRTDVFSRPRPLTLARRLRRRRDLIVLFSLLLLHGGRARRVAGFTQTTNEEKQSSTGAAAQPYCSVWLLLRDLGRDNGASNAHCSGTLLIQFPAHTIFRFLFLSFSFF